MSRLGWRKQRPFRLFGAGVALAAAVLPGIARTEPVLPGPFLLTLDLTWTAALMPAPWAPADMAEPPPLLSFDDAPNRLFAQQSPSPGLQFTLDPENEEVFLGWQFEF